MIDAIHISSNGLKINQEWLDSISNNVANMQTPAYKRTDVHFSEVVSSSAVHKDEIGTPTEPNGMGALIMGTTVDTRTGNLKSTGRELDIAINGNGYFEVVKSDGSLAYTRYGSFAIDASGALVTSRGYQLSDEIYVPPEAKKLTISEEGIVSAELDGDFGAVELGQIGLVTFNSAQNLNSIGGGMFMETPQSGNATLSVPGQEGSGQLMQGFMEMSNVEMVEEMTNLVLAQRAYQLNARLIQTADQILETVNNLRR